MARRKLCYWTDNAHWVGLQHLIPRKQEENTQMARRIQMKPDAAPEPIITEDGRRLGNFLPGFGYWITPQNEAICRKVIEDGRAIEVDENYSPFNKAGLKIGAQDGMVLGSISIEE